MRPQVWLTLIWHMGLRMPWSWKSGPSTASERDHFGQMLREQQFPENTLFCGDAGFTGYDLWKAAIDREHEILIRVGANVTLFASWATMRASATGSSIAGPRRQRARTSRRSCCD